MVYSELGEVVDAVADIHDDNVGERKQFEHKRDYLQVIADNMQLRYGTEIDSYEDYTQKHPLDPKQGALARMAKGVLMALAVSAIAFTGIVLIASLFMPESPILSASIFTSPEKAMALGGSLAGGGAIIGLLDNPAHRDHLKHIEGYEAYLNNTEQVLQQGKGLVKSHSAAHEHSNPLAEGKTSTDFQDMLAQQTASISRDR